MKTWILFLLLALALPATGTDLATLRPKGGAVATVTDAASTTTNTSAQSFVDDLLATLNASGATGGTLDISGGNYSAPSQPNSFDLTGADLAYLNRAYTDGGMLNGKTIYENVDDNTIVMRWSGSRWELWSDPDTAYAYFSSENVAYPWLVVSWTRDETSTGPTIAQSLNTDLVNLTDNLGWTITTN